MEMRVVVFRGFDQLYKQKFVDLLLGLHAGIFLGWEQEVVLLHSNNSCLMLLDSLEDHCI